MAGNGHLELLITLEYAPNAKHPIGIRRGVNKAESIALDFLVNHLKVDKEAISFFNNKSPDLTYKNIGFEVKQLKRGIISFTKRQWEYLKQKGYCYIVIVDIDNDNIQLVPFSSMNKNQRDYDTFSIRIINPKDEQERFTMEEWRILVKKFGASLSRYEMRQKLHKLGYNSPKESIPQNETVALPRSSS